MARFGRFLYYWIKSFVPAHVVVRWALAAAAVAALFLPTPRFTIAVTFLIGPTIATTLPIGPSLVGLALLVWGIATVQSAWQRSCGPVLVVGEQLEADPPHHAYRLRVSNENVEPAEVQAWLMRAVTDDGTPVLPMAQLPIELHWSHRPGRPSLRAGVPATVGVLLSCGVGQVTIGGMTYAPTLYTQQLAFNPEKGMAEKGEARPVNLLVRVAAGAIAEERGFRVSADDSVAGLSNRVEIIAPTAPVFSPH